MISWYIKCTTTTTWAPKQWSLSKNETINSFKNGTPQRKGRLPQYARHQLLELQQKFDVLEALGVFRRPEDINVEYLIKKVNGGYHLVTAFADVGRYSKPQPSLMPNVHFTLRLVVLWKHIVATDLTSAFYQIPLSQNCMKYCGIATWFRVWVCMHGLPWACQAQRRPSCRTGRKFYKPSTDVQYWSNVSWQSLETRTTRLDPRNSNILRIEARVEFRDVWGRSRIYRVEFRDFFEFRDFRVEKTKDFTASVCAEVPKLSGFFSLIIIFFLPFSEWILHPLRIFNMLQWDGLLWVIIFRARFYWVWRAVPWEKYVCLLLTYL